MNAFDRPKTPYSNNLVSSMRMNVDEPLPLVEAGVSDLNSIMSQ
jgi:hypothetical protein